MRNQYLVASNLGKLDVPFLIYANFFCYIHITTNFSCCQKNYNSFLSIFLLFKVISNSLFIKFISYPHILAIFSMVLKSGSMAPVSYCEIVFLA